MKKIIAAIAVMLVMAAAVMAFEKSKTIEKSYQVKPSQRIEIMGFSGSDITFRSWDKNEVLIRLKVRFSSSDDDYEDEYIKALRVEENNQDDVLTLRLKETKNEGGGTSFLGIKFKFGFYQKKEIKGEIFIPGKNSLTSDFKYGTMSLEGIQGEINLDGKSNTLRLKNCSRLQNIMNDYGRTNIENSGGNLILAAKSSNVTISSFNGPADINADYSTCRLSDIGGNLNLISKSGTQRISDVKGSLKLNAEYSTIDISNIQGFVSIRSKSAGITVNKAGGITVDADYTNLTVSNISGRAGKEIYIKGRSGRVDLEDAVGDVRIDNPYSNMNLRNINGNVSITGQSSTVSASGINGSWNSNTQYVTFRLRDLNSGSIRMKNKSGNIELASKSAPQEVDIRNEYGAVSIDMPKGFSGEVDLSAEYGDISTDLPLKVRERGSSMQAYGKSGNGQGRITIETRSGDIKIREL